VPVGLLLSGGTDSSLIACLLKNKNVKPYCFGWDKTDEEVIRAREVSKSLGIELKEIYFSETQIPNDLIKKIKEFIGLYGEPINLLQIIYLEVILKELKKDGIKVVLSGNGADELFYGYDGMNKLYLVSTVKGLLEKLRIASLFKSVPHMGFLALESWDIKSKLYENSIKRKNFIKKKYQSFLLKDSFKEFSKEIPSKKMIDIFSWIGLRVENEHSVTIVADLSGMKNGVEIRTPFLNKEIIYFSQNIQPNFKVHSFFSKKYNKYLMKKVLEKYLPKELVYQKKMGFGFNILANLNLNNLITQNKSLFQYYIDKIVPRIDIYRPEEIRTLFNEHISGKKDNSNYLMEILIVCIWFEIFILKDQTTSFKK
jgi:asparagine synthase (glutamine-hydrolysing)